MIKTDRKSDYPVEKVILNRWSPRAFSKEPVTYEELMALFDAARWAPSSGNNQPWRFLYAWRGQDYWDTFLSFLVPKNEIWAKNASVLILVLSKKTKDKNNKPIKTHSFDTGAATQNMAIQATSMGLIMHGMEGMDYERAKIELNIPDDYQIEAMFAVGKIGNKEDLPENLQEREKPSNRKSINDYVFEGKFPANGPK